ncbi:MAG: hypothetical protein HY446_00755, partial [Candidatus Niyogibacteria bacterium]|nr:hypothetical protein [Candidatus Niyogibacteria bacterium]
LERLRKRLYKKEEKFERRFEEPQLSYKPERARAEWETRPAEEIIAESLKPRPFLNMKSFVWAAGIFVVVVGALAAIYLFGGFGYTSSRNIEISISGPKEIGGGELARWEVSVRNRNDAKLASAELSFRYPQGSKPAAKVTSQSLIERKSLGEIPAEGIVKETFSAFVFGPESFEGELEAVLEYRLEGSNAIFEKSEKTSVRISRSPLGVSIKIPAELNAGREINFEVSYISNSSEIIKGLTLELIYPPGFFFKDSKPKPAENNNRWNLGDLAPGEERSISLSGVFEGEDMDKANLAARVGVLEGGSLTVYGGSSAEITLRRLFVELAAKVNNEDKPVVRAGDSLSVEVSWRNNLPQAVRNATVEIELVGDAIDERSILVINGFYRGSDKKIVWSPSSVSGLSTLEPGQSGRAQFSFKILDAVSLSKKNITNPTIKMAGQIKPSSGPDSFENIDITGKFESEYKIETSLQLSSRGFYNLTSLRGSGPLPPRVGRETVYTAVWTLANISNDASGVEVKASLPAYVSWKGVVRPSGEEVVYDESRSEVRWRLGPVKAGVGISQPAREVMFQIGLTPSPDQIGDSPTLLFDIAAQGRDDFTGNLVSDSELSLTTDISSFDSGVRFTDGRVVE